MAWSIRQDFHIDVGASFGAVLVKSGDDSALRHPAPDVVSGDKMPVRFYFWERGEADELTAADPGSGSTLRFSGRPATVPPGSDLLFLSETFTEISAGVWEGEVDLNKAELMAHLEAAPVGAKTIVAEVEVEDAAGGRKSLQWPMVIRPEVYEGQDAPTSLPAPREWLDERLATLGVRPVRDDIAPAGAALPSGTLIPYELTVDGELLGDDGEPIELATMELGSISGDTVTGYGSWSATLPDTGTLSLALDGGTWVLEYDGPAAASPITRAASATTTSPLSAPLVNGADSVTLIDVAGYPAPARGDLGHVSTAGDWYRWDGIGWEYVLTDAVRLTGAQAVAGAKTWSGLQRATGQNIPPATADEVITRGSGDNRYFREVVRTLSADHVVTSDATPGLASPLAADLVSGRTYRVFVQIVATSSVAAGIRAGIAGPAGKYRLMRWRNTVRERFTVATNSHELALSEDGNYYWYEGIITPAANGSLEVTFSQETSSVDATTMTTHSRIEAVDVTDTYSEITP